MILMPVATQRTSDQNECLLVQPNLLDQQVISPLTDFLDGIACEAYRPDLAHQRHHTHRRAIAEDTALLGARKAQRPLGDIELTHDFTLHATFKPAL